MSISVLVGTAIKCALSLRKTFQISICTCKRFFFSFFPICSKKTSQLVRCWILCCTSSESASVALQTENCIQKIFLIQLNNLFSISAYVLVRYTLRFKGTETVRICKVQLIFVLVGIMRAKSYEAHTVRFIFTNLFNRCILPQLSLIHI